jgi:hypothetical protein
MLLILLCALLLGLSGIFSPCATSVHLPMPPFMSIKIVKTSPMQSPPMISGTPNKSAKNDPRSSDSRVAYKPGLEPSFRNASSKLKTSQYHRRPGQASPHFQKPLFPNATTPTPPGRLPILRCGVVPLPATPNCWQRDMRRKSWPLGATIICQNG